ncbi:hypothetical protein M9458_009405, partial [Cirrhinus mrigala]
ATDEPSLIGATELRIALEPEPITSDRVREPATTYATVDVTAEHEGAKDSPTHSTSAEGELKPELGLQDGELDLIDFHSEIYADMPLLLAPSPELSICPEPSTFGLFPPTPPLLPSPVFRASAPPPLSPDSPSAHPQPTICAVASPRVCQFPSVSWLKDPSSPPPAS